MRLYTIQHAHYCGIDLHARTMYLCILNAAGEVVLHRNMPSSPEAFRRAIEPYREDHVIGVECIFTWYWLADLCERKGIAFVLGHALYMRAIHGGKAENDKIDTPNPAEPEPKEVLLVLGAAEEGRKTTKSQGADGAISRPRRSFR